MRILYVFTTAFVPAVVLRGQCLYLKRQGFEVLVAASPDEYLDRLAVAEGISTLPVMIRREISPVQDLRSLWKLVILMRRLRPDIVNGGTPKASLLAMLAAWLTRVPCRVYWLHGLRFETTTGLKRRILTLAERAACKLANVVPCVSPSVRDGAVASRLLPAGKTMVMGAGSANGVDMSRFIATPERLGQASRVRTELRIPRDARVVGFVGRLTRDKGVGELVKAFLALLPQFESCHLLFVGDFEEDDPVSDEIRSLIAEHPRITVTGFVTDAGPYYHIMDVLAIPSYREGFSTVALEAHCAKRPVVASRVTGLVDAIDDGVDGLLVPAGDNGALSQALSRVLGNAVMSNQLGEAGFRRVRELFQSQAVWSRIQAFYLELLRGADREESQARFTVRGFEAPGRALLANRQKWIIDHENSISHGRRRFHRQPPG